MSALGGWYESQVPVLAAELKPMFTRLLDGIDPAEVTGLGLFSDQFDFTLTQAVNTREALLAYMKEHVEAGLGDAQDALLEGLWNPGGYARLSVELPSDDQRRDPAVQFAEEAQRRSEQSGEYELGAQLFLECLVRAMAVLFKEGFFDPYPNAVQVVEVVDGDQDHDVLLRWMGHINTPEALEKYRQYLALQE